MRIVSGLLLLFGVQFISAGKPFQSGNSVQEVIFLAIGAFMLVIFNAIMWDRAGGDR